MYNNIKGKGGGDMFGTGNKTRLDSSWSRMEYFRHFYDDAPCAVSLCDDIDVTVLEEACRRTGEVFYHAMLYTVTKVINAHEEFRLTAVESPEDEFVMPAVWDTLHPAHNVFHKDTETFTSLFSLWDGDYRIFADRVREDLDRARLIKTRAVPCLPNTFEASCLPWRHFTSVGVETEGFDLAPMVVWGKAQMRNGRAMMPLSIRAHHAACDGFHLARFLNEAEEGARELAEKLLNQEYRR